MDKRTLLFVLLLTFVLLGINTYFDRQREGDVRKWHEQLKIKTLAKQKQIEAEISSNTAKASDLPLVSLYSDAEGKEFVTSGILIDQSVLTLKWTDTPPETLYSKKQGSDQTPQALKLASGNTPSSLGEPILYQQGPAAPLKIGTLPDFGRLDLQLITFSPNDLQNPFNIYVSNFTNGNFSILEDELAKLRSEGGENEASKAAAVRTNGIALLKTDNGYLPVGFYQAATKHLTYLGDATGIQTTVSRPVLKNGVKTGQKAEEAFYVLETSDFQLVFSNFGGALAEINLPFESETNKESVVKEIEFDREMVAKHPYNARFPAHPYFTPAKSTSSSTESTATDAFEEHAQGKLGGYYPLIRRDLIEKGTRQSIKIKPQYYALNIVSDYPEVAELVYEVKQFDDTHIVFETTQNYRRITKTFSIDNEAPYSINVAVKIEGDSRGLWMTSGVPEVEWISGAPAPVLKYRITRNQKSVVEQIDLPKDATTVTTSSLDWICNSNGFLGLILDPLVEKDPGYRVQFVPGQSAPSRLVEIDQENNRFPIQSLPGYTTLLPIKATGGTTNFRIFAGPFAEGILKTVDKKYSDPETGYNPDYIACQSFHGWFAFISEPFAKFLLILMRFFHYLTGSWAFSIVLLTVALRVMLYPLNAWSSKSMIRMQQIAPDVTAIQEKYKKDPKKAQIEVMNLYRERGVNPISGCLPLLIQMPFLIGMFDLLKSTFELRGASFIPGWIDDLSAPDVLFSWNTSIMFIGNQFHLLPILLGVVMFVQQRFMSSQPVDPANMTEQQRQQRMMGTIMSLVFMLMFYNFPSGLNIYWLSSMLLGMLQQWWTVKTMKAPPAAKGKISQAK